MSPRLRAAIQGAMVGIAYGAIERLFTAVLPSLIFCASCQYPPDWRFSLILAAVYAAVGAVIAMVAQAVAKKQDAGHFGRSAALIAMIILYQVYAWHAMLTGESERSLKFYAPGIVIQTIVTLALAVMPLKLAGRATTYAAGVSVIVVPVILISLWFIAVGVMYRASRAAKLTTYIVLCLIAGTMALALMSLLSGRKGRTLGIIAVVSTLIVVMSCGQVAAIQPLKPVLREFSVAHAHLPNIVIITLDTVRAENTSLYGYGRDTTPFLKKLSNQTTVFENAISSSNCTLSSHGSLFTGLEARTHGAHYASRARQGRPLSSENWTMAELLRVQGYQTAAVVANTAYLARSIGFAQGFDYYDDGRALPFFRNTAQYTFAQRIRNVIVRFFRPGVFERETRDATSITDAATKVLRARRPDRPFLLFVNYLDAHDPYVPIPPYDRIFGLSIDTVDLEEYLNAGKRTPTPSERRVLVAQYDGSIRQIDDQLQRFVQELRSQELWDNTLVVITSDHGEELENGTIGHGRAVTDHEIHIPLLVKFPAQKIGSRRSEVVSLIDVLPTVLQITGHQYANQLPGRDLRRPIARDRVVFSENFTRDDRRSVACVKEHRKLVLDLNGQWSLIDRDTSPPRTIYEPAETALLRKAVEHWMRITPIYKGQNERGIIESKELRALGYLR